MIEHKDVALDLKGFSEDGSFTGYASVFGERDLQDDVVERGAFVGSIRKRRGRFPLLWHHKPDEPIGSIEAEEDRRGLRVSGRLLLGVERGREVYELIKSKVVRGLSIGFRILEERVDRMTGARHLLKLDLWEISAVTFPANPLAQVSRVKGASVQAPDLEDLGISDLRRAFGLEDGHPFVKIDVPPEVQAELDAAVKFGCEDLGIPRPRIYAVRKARDGEVPHLRWWSPTFSGSVDLKKRIVLIRPEECRMSGVAKVVLHELAHIAGRDEDGAVAYEEDAYGRMRVGEMEPPESQRDRQRRLMRGQWWA